MPSSREMLGKKKELYLKQSGLCFWCGERMLSPDDTSKGPSSPTLDHIVPKAAGGKREENLRVACFECNTLRGQYNTPLWKNNHTKLTKELAKLNQTVINLKTRLLKLETLNAELTSILLKYLDQPLWYRIFGKLFGNKLRDIPVPEINGIIEKEEKVEVTQKSSHSIGPEFAHDSGS